MELTVFRSNFVNALQSSIEVHLDKYLQDEVWITGLSTAQLRDLLSRVEVEGDLALEIPQDGGHRDSENAIRLHRALRALTPLQARDPRLWTRLSHVELWPYMRRRWPIDRYIGDRPKASRYVESRYFVAQNQSRALVRNGIARLWWIAHLSYDHTKSDPYELTTVMLSSLDITQQIVERNMGRSASVLHGFLDFLVQNRETLLTGGNENRSRIRMLAKHLNLYGGVTLLDLLSRSEVTEVLNREYERISEKASITSA